MKHSKSFCALVIPLLFASVAPAKWTVTQSDGPENANLERGLPDVYGGSPGKSVGVAKFPNSVWKASLQDHTTNTWIDLNPFGSARSIAYGTDGTQQVGYARPGGINGPQRAALWTGTSTSVIYLTDPAVGAPEDVAYSCSGGQQVGQSNRHAALWSGTPGSLVDLHPPFALQSAAYGIFRNQQVGSVLISQDVRHASVWNGIAASFVDLNPLGTGNRSLALAADSGQIVGIVNAISVDRDDPYGTASLWTTGTASSWVNLTPSNNYPYGACLGVSGGYQVGFLGAFGTNIAIMWNGSSSSHVNLHSLLVGYNPDNSSASRATAISRAGDVIYISGFGHDSHGGAQKALLWRHDVSSVSGRVNTGGGRALASIQIQFKDNSPDGGVRSVGTPISVPLGENGDYTVSAPVGSDAYRITVKPTGFLRSTVDANVVAGDLTDINLNLVPGDIVNDNVIDLSDYTKLISYFNRTSADTDWSEADTDGIRPSDCDLNGDGVVDLTDYTLVVTNFNAVGDI